MVFASISTTQANASISISLVPCKSTFKLLRKTVSSSTSKANYTYNKRNFSSCVSSYVFSQDAIGSKLYVGVSKFSEVGCELAACYNAIYRLTGSKAKGDLPYLIKIAEEKGYTMALAHDAIRIILEITKKADDYKQYRTAGAFGTDPFAIPSILNAAVYAKVKTTYSGFSSMDKAVKAAIKSKENHVYIVSFWNSGVVDDGVHTVCFYTENGHLYDLNNSNRIKTAARELVSLSQIIGNSSNRFIVGYEIVKR